MVYNGHHTHATKRIQQAVSLLVALTVEFLREEFASDLLQCVVIGWLGCELYFLKCVLSRVGEDTTLCRGQLPT